MPESTASFSVAGARRNGNRNQTLNRLVSVEAAFDRALRSGLHVSDGSLYEAAKPATAEPEIELIEEVGAKGLRERNLPVPDCDYHLRVEFSDGTEWFISFNGTLKTDTDGERSFLEPQLWNFHIDGQAAMPEAVEHLLAPQGVDVIEEWLLGDRRAK